MTDGKIRRNYCEKGEMRMSLTDSIKDFIKLVPAMKEIPSHSAWISYDEEADTISAIDNL